MQARPMRQREFKDFWESFFSLDKFLKFFLTLVGIWWYVGGSQHILVLDCEHRFPSLHSVVSYWSLKLVMGNL